MCGSTVPPPMPGQCLTTGTSPLSWATLTDATTNCETLAGSVPKVRVPRPEPLPTSATGANTMLKPRSFTPVWWRRYASCAASTVPAPSVVCDGSLPRAAASRCTVPPSSSAATNGWTGAPCTASATWVEMAADCAPLSPNPPTVPLRTASAACAGLATMTISSWPARASGGSISAQSGGSVVVVERATLAFWTFTPKESVPVQAVRTSERRAVATAATVTHDLGRTPAVARSPSDSSSPRALTSPDASGAGRPAHLGQTVPVQVCAPMTSAVHAARDAGLTGVAR